MVALAVVAGAAPSPARAQEAQGQQPGAAPAGRATPPRALNYAPPELPPEAVKAGLEGTVTLQLDVDRAGRVTGAVVVESAGHGFDEAALAAAKKLDFEPARRADGSAAAARILYRYSFTQAPSAPPADAAAARKPAESLTGTVLARGLGIGDGIGDDVALAGAAVSLRRAPEGATAANATTDERGGFVFPDLAPGRYEVTIAAPGFAPLAVEEEIAAGEQTAVKYRLLPLGDGLEVTVRSSSPPREVTKRTLDQREISRIPGTNGDALRGLLNLPGVARPPGPAGLLLVRGSAFEDTQTFIDGVYVPLIYHFGGLSSVVPTEMIAKLDFYPGNMSARYGRVHGGIVDVGLRSPKDDGELHALGQVDFIDGRIVVEGPVPLLKGVRFAAAGRRSWIGDLLGPVLESAGAGVTQVPVYYDYQLVVEAEPTPTSRVRLGLLGSDDAFELLLSNPQPNDPAFSGTFGLHTAFQRLQVVYENDLTDKDKLRAVLAIGRDDRSLQIGTISFTLDNELLLGRLEYSRRLAPSTRFNAGIDLLSGHYDATFRGPGLDRPGAPPNQPFVTRAVQEVSLGGYYAYPAGYIEVELAPSPRVKIVPGLRVDYQDVSDQLDVSPRVNGRYDLVPGSPRTTLKGGIGVFDQPPQVQEMTAPVGNPRLKSVRSLHYALGVEQEIGRRIEGSAEAFYKQLDDVVVGVTSPTSVNVDYENLGTGRVYGVELLLKYKPDARFFGWVAYTLSRSTRIDGPGAPERLVSFDQTHILTVLGSYKLGHGWELGARFRLVSGDLTTPYGCDVGERSCDPLRPGALFHAPSGAYVPLPNAAVNSERLPLFHALDLRLDKRWRFKSWQLSAYLDVQNAYNNANREGIEYNFNYTARSYASGLPILPSVGIRGER